MSKQELMEVQKGTIPCVRLNGVLLIGIRRDLDVAMGQIEVASTVWSAIGQVVHRFAPAPRPREGHTAD
jgi:hypothetical protein